MLWQCLHCGFVFKEAQEADYRNMSEEYFGVYNYDRSPEVAGLLSVLQQYLGSVDGLRLVEIGCGNGSLLAEFKERGVGVWGFEPSPTAARIAASEYGLTTVENSYFTAAALRVKPNVLLLHDVLEHLYDPRELLTEVRASMSDETILLIRSGDPTSLNARLYPSRWLYYLVDEHIAFYSQKALKILCDDVGLSLERYDGFRHAYGGLALSQLAKNVIKAVLLKMTPQRSHFHSRYAIDYANDHFIAVVRKQKT